MAQWSLVCVDENASQSMYIRCALTRGGNAVHAPQWAPITFDIRVSRDCCNSRLDLLLAWSGGHNAGSGLCRGSANLGSAGEHP